MYFGKCLRDFYNALVPQQQQQSNDDDDVDIDGVVGSLQQFLDQGLTIVEIAKSQMSRMEGLLLSADVVSNADISLSSSAAPVRLISLPSLGSNKGGTKQSSLPSLRGGSRNNKRSFPGEENEEVSSSSIATTLKTNAKPPPASSSVSSSYQQRTKRPASLSENSSGGSDINPSIRAKLESRKKMKTMTDRTTPHPYRSRNKSSIREGSSSVGSGKSKGGLRAILASQTEEEGEDNSDDSDSDDFNNINYVMAKRSADSCASAAVTAKRSAESCASAADSSNVNDSLFQDISPIDQEPTTSVKDMDLNYLLNWDPTKRSEKNSSKKRVTIAENASKKKTAAAPVLAKITKNDLGYMLNWNPFGKFEKRDDEDEELEDNSSSSGTKVAEAGVVVQQSTTTSAAQGMHNNNNNNMSTIDEATEGSMTSGQGDNSHGTSQSRASSSSQASTAKNNNNSESRKSRSSVGTSCNEENEKSSSSSSSALMIPTSKLECSLLPLIEKKNIIHVEDEPYAKLGVIGKGGSCKVYRALSRDCDVVALKKVKLDGLNKAAIDGYANEIALLKRLKGNPAIIQLYSAEVDLERKSILLVMELGEVDLNYVLRQQELMSSKQPQGRAAGRSSLNMNFIRLTWQQMLTAVHSIHEERIIHSDLKPAVRRSILYPFLYYVSIVLHMLLFFYRTFCLSEER